jgi:hypothetical protein
MLEATRKSVKNYIDKTFDFECKRLHSITNQSRLHYDEGTINNVSMKNRIDYEPNTRKEWSGFKKLIHYELKP